MHAKKTVHRFLVNQIKEREKSDQNKLKNVLNVQKNMHATINNNKEEKNDHAVLTAL